MKTIKTTSEGGILFAEIVAPPTNLLGPELVRDLVSLIRLAETDRAVSRSLDRGSGSFFSAEGRT